MLINPVILVLIIVSALVNVECQVCFKAVRGYAARRRFIITRICCEGYALEPGNKEVSVDTCKPICTTNCTNGYCKRPDECACNAGYTLRNDTCAPLCEDCSHGACVAPDTCQCYAGYDLVVGTCQPVCTTPCVHGTCVAPDTCQCLPGYRQSDLKGSDCEPICSSGCFYGDCKAPETCVCHSGWRNSNGTCSPVCNVPCGNGTCIFPNVCACFLGYRNTMLRSRGVDDAPVCKPVCKNCNGVCIAPNQCKEKTQTMIALATTSTNSPNNNLADGILMTKSYTTFYWSSTENLDHIENSTLTLDSENSTVTLEKLTEYSWMKEHQIILISLVVIVTTGIIVFIVWQRLPMKIIYFFKGKSYNIKGAGLRRNISNSFVNIQFLSQLESRS